jgi:hypothetical protein
MTVAEIARELGYTHFCGILAPFVYQCIPHRVLASLQKDFHNLIRKDLQKQKCRIADFRLPDLVVLTEMKEPLMWFPLKPSPVKGV